MSQNVLLQAKGLYSFPNRISAIPNGALLRAKNIVINRDNIAESRRGYKIYGSSMGSGSATSAHQLLNYKGRILRHWGSGSGTNLDADSDGSGTFTNFSIVLTGNTTNASPNITNLSLTSQLNVGMFVSGTGIPNNTTILSITNNTSIVLSQNATANNSGISLTFTYNISEVTTGLRLKGIEQNGNFYFTSNRGIRKISSSDASTLSSQPITLAGGVKALDVQATINAGAGFLTPQSTVAYRIVWGIKDLNQNLILGTPSERVIIKNTDLVSSKTVDLRITIPKLITTANFYQVYRTAVISYINTFAIVGNTANTSTTITNMADTSSLVVGMAISGTGIPASTTISSISSTSTIEISNAATATNTGVSLTVTQTLDLDPGDEQALVYENNPLLTDLNNGYVSVTDVTPDSFRGANLYTNANSGEGIDQANDIPPLSKDIVSFKGYTFYANTQTLERLNLSLLSVSGLKSYHTGTISANSVANPTQVTTSTNHGLTTGRTVTITGSNSTPSINGSYTVTVTGATTFTIPVNVTIAGNSGTFTTNDHSTFTVTDGTTSTTYRFGTSEDIVNKQVLISTASTPAQQVDETSRSLIRVINNQSSEIIYGYYLSGVSDVPGLILLEARDLSQIAFYLNVNSASTTGIEFSPNLPVSGNSVISDNEICPNRIYYSKSQQPEAVPIVNYIDVGPKDKAIIRTLALRDNLFILKEEGVYRLSGLVAPFTVYPFDFSTNIKAPDSAVVLNNLIYMFSNQGVTTVSDTGVSIISRPIEDQLINLVTPQFTNFNSATFGISYESDRAYYLFTLTNTTDTYATQCFRFNTFTNTWTLLDLFKRSGIVNFSDDKLYLGAADTNSIEQERKNFDRTDFADREISRSIGPSAVNGNIITLSPITNISVGDVLVQTQYLTISQFNRLLSKLDRDSLLTYHNYFNTLQAISGINLSDQFDVLIATIRDDAGRQSVSGHTSDASYTALIGTGSASFSALQTAFNNLITLLNNDVGVGYKNYINSSGVVNFEFNITSVSTSRSTISTTYSYPLIQGPITIYNHIETQLQFVPQFLSDVSMTKHISEGTFIFEDANFTSGVVSYSTDLSADFENDTINGIGNGIFGNNVYGQGIYGGDGSGIPFRTYIPKEKQRCRYINCRFQHSVAREIFSLYGISLTFNPISQRGWK